MARRQRVRRRVRRGSNAMVNVEPPARDLKDSDVYVSDHSRPNVRGRRPKADVSARSAVYGIITLKGSEGQWRTASWKT